MNNFACEVGTLTFKFLGIPIYYRKLLNTEWKSVKDHFECKLASWLGKMLSYGDRLALTNSFLTSLPIFLYLSLRYPKGYREHYIFIDLDSSGKLMS
jgi:hypothetical protein